MHTTEAPANAGSALVTGSSRGLGAAIARRLGADGWAVAVNYASDAGGAQKVVDDIVAEGGRAQAFQADVTDETSVGRLVAEIGAALGPVEVVIANATGPQPLVAAQDLTWQDHLDQLVFFVKSPTLLMQAALPGMTAIGRGRIVAIGSDAFDRAIPQMSAYNAAKGAQVGLVRTWATELGQHGITVNIVSPGWIPVERHDDVPQEDRDAYAAALPARRMGTPEDVADVVAFVASDASRFVTGQRITVNGGHTSI